MDIFTLRPFHLGKSALCALTAEVQEEFQCAKAKRHEGLWGNGGENPRIFNFTE
jgi:hypothetical protein